MNIANKPVKSSKAVRVAGFDFPLTCEEDVDRLELMVNRNPFIKSQYIKYLTIHKPRNVDVGQIFNRFFDDEAMANFTWTGSDSTTAAKKAMKDYAIFTGCMLGETFRCKTQSSTTLHFSFAEAWSDQGVTDDLLVESLKKALLLISRRRYVKNYNQRKRLQLKGAET
ncbi:uncharacterized protein LOC128093741 isoform X1 [Culex pipiens pallens]|uniref:uncharacterized protein LOC128093741 isoform X1 n=1 Tax=Culex pipiens pallens TaxID=42434 RepID=UPI0022AA376F|nr:uncharacterized protein LOC128093741 isoform X1 [Culex pipiens pallens]